MLLHHTCSFVFGFIALLFLFIPLLVMLITNEVNWTISDFLVAGGLLLSAGFL